MKLSKTDIRDAFFGEIYQIGKKDKNIIFISDDMDAFSLKKFRKDLPKQYVNIGVAEQNMIDLAAGLATTGKKVFVYGICSYVTTRCLEQIKFSVCSMNLPVTIIGIGAGFSFNFDGPSHHGTCDIGVMRMLPEITILNPADAFSAKESVHIAYKNKGPVYIRLDKGYFPKIYTSSTDVSRGYKIVLNLKDTNIITTGFMLQQTLHALESIQKTSQVGLVDLFKIKPISKNFIQKVIRKSKKIITIEENSIISGIGTIISELITDNGLNIRLKRLAVKDHQFDQFGGREWLQSLNGLDIKSIQRSIIEFSKY